MSITSGNIINSESVFNESEPTYDVNIAGNQINGYTIKCKVYSPAGYFSRPMPGRQALYALTPYGGTGYAMGFANESPDPSKATNNIIGLEDGESAISETSNFNFNIQVKLDKLLSIFTNNNSNQINSTIAIGENLVTCLKDIIAEIVALELAYNTLITTYNGHTHQYNPGSNPLVATGSVSVSGSSYSAQSDFNRDKTFINQSPSQMFINLDGDLIT